MSKKTMMFGSLLIGLGGAFAVLGTVWWLNGPDEDTWLYVFCGWLVIYSGWEIYVAMKKNSKDK